VINLVAKNVSVSLGNTLVLSGVNFEVNTNEVVGLIGPNGAGKTTLLRVLAGLLKPSTGTLHLAGRPENDFDRRARARMIAYLPQDGESHWPVSVQTLVMLGRLAHIGPMRAPSKADHTAVFQALETCDADQFIDRPVNELSGGERARVLLARAIASAPQVLLADEPVSGLDPAHQLDVMNTLCELSEQGTATVVVMHDLSLAARFCHRLVLLFDGRAEASGPPDLVLSNENLARCYGINARHGRVDDVPYIIPLNRISSGTEDESI